MERKKISKITGKKKKIISLVIATLCIGGVLKLTVFNTKASDKNI
ncbi:hypothetical protein [Clostridium sp.]